MLSTEAYLTQTVCAACKITVSTSLPSVLRPPLQQGLGKKNSCPDNFHLTLSVKIWYTESLKVCMSVVTATGGKTCRGTIILDVLSLLTWLQVMGDLRGG